MSIQMQTNQSFCLALFQRFIFSTLCWRSETPVSSWRLATQARPASGRCRGPPLVCVRATLAGKPKITDLACKFLSLWFGATQFVVVQPSSLFLLRYELISLTLGATFRGPANQIGHPQQGHHTILAAKGGQTNPSRRPPPLFAPLNPNLDGPNDGHNPTTD